MSGRGRLAVGALLVVLLAGATAFLVRETFFHPLAITAYFPSATGIYAGDEIRVSGVKVGTVGSVQPQPSRARVTLRVDRGVPIPADAKAVIVAQNLVAARYVQLTPAYRRTGPTMRDGAVIGLDRTAVPVEWDEVTKQLTRLATDLGPNGDMSATAVSRFIDSAAGAMDGNGEKLRQTLAQLSGIGRILAHGSGNIVDIIKNLQNFVTTLRDSNQQIVQFQNRLATLSSVINDSRSDLDAALSNLSVAVGEVQRFVAGTRDKTSEQIQRLADVTQVLVDHRLDVENILHAAPTAFANGYNIYNPNTPGAMGSFIINNFSNPTQFLCGAIGAAANVTAAETGKLCGEYLGPGLRTANFNELPIPTNLILQQIATPGKIIYAEPRLAPGGEGPRPQAPDIPPAVSAYAGLTDTAPRTVDDMLLPGQGPPP
ncbi:mammalian cell entry protein [Mycobacterium alsense]|uniref:MCE family protein n=1 Tax=Mycobacterium alsense TaxID=324058 RepID=A0AA42BZY9_9MYCO|nr:MCE family protein [Mycobacterium alsense]MCV7380936.1 MCE family protein [Mycobacterium alsense]OQZ91349.1 mammalian cell entry protein [Mycobacterium alsense]